MSQSLLRTWWGMINIDNELAGNPPIADDAVILHFSGSGASCFLTKKDLDNAIEESAALEKDAERYRYLRDAAGPELCVVQTRERQPLYDALLDASIDAALADEKEQAK